MATRVAERFVHRGEIVVARVDARAHGIDITQRRAKLQCLREQALALEQLQQALRATLDETVAHRWEHKRSRVDQELGARRASEVALSVRMATVAVRARRHAEQAALLILASPGKQGGILG